MKMITPETLDIASLPSLLISDRKRMPNIAACYLVLEEELVIYIGQSSSLVIRWLSHNKLKEIKARKTEIRVAWIEVSDPQILPIIEKALIQYFKPVLNRVLIREPKLKKEQLPKTDAGISSKCRNKKIGKFASPYVEPVTNPKYIQDEKTGRFTSSGLPVVARKPISVKLPPEIDDVVRSMPNRAEFLREVITKAVLELEQQSA